MLVVAEHHVSTLFAASERMKLTVFRMKRRRRRGIRMSRVALLKGVEHGYECNVVSSVGEGSAMNFTLYRG